MSEVMLPSGWIDATLNELFVSITDGDHLPPPQTTTGVPFLVIGDVRQGAIDFFDCRFVSETYYESLADSRRPRRNDVLYTVTGSYGIPVLVDTDRSFCVQRHIAILRPHDAISPKFYARILAAPLILAQANAVATGTAQKTVSLKGLRGFVVPVPPVPEQHRIVDALDSYFTRLDDAIATLERVQRNLKRYRASVLKAAVEGRLVPTEAELARAEGREYEPASKLLERILVERRRRWEEAELAKLKASGKVPKDDKWKAKYEEPAAPDTSELPELPEGWCWVTLPQIGELNRGKSKHRPRNDPRLLGGPYPFIQTGDVRKSECFIDSYEATYSEFGLAQSRLWPPETLCITIAANIAETGILRFAACFPDSVVGFVGAGTFTQTRYIELFLRTARADLARYAPSTAQKNINLETLSALAIPLPPAAEQQRMVDALDNLLSVARHDEEALEAALKRCHRLRQSILKWAFEGKLVDQDPNDEPASVLLERIRAERAETDTARKQARPAKRS